MSDFYKGFSKTAAVNPKLIGALGLGGISGAVAAANSNREETKDKIIHDIIPSALLGAGLGALMAPGRIGKKGKNLSDAIKDRVSASAIGAQRASKKTM